MTLPSEPIGSLPRTRDVLNALAGGDSTALAKAVDVAVRETVGSVDFRGPVLLSASPGLGSMAR